MFLELRELPRSLLLLVFFRLLEALVFTLEFEDLGFVVLLEACLELHVLLRQCGNRSEKTRVGDRPYMGLLLVLLVNLVLKNLTRHAPRV